MINHARVLAVMLACSAIQICGIAAAADAAAPVTAHFGYVSLKVTDLQRSLAFYTKVLGMTEGRHLGGGPGVTEVLLGFGSPQKEPGVMLIHDAKRTTPYEHGDGFSRFILYVANLEELSKKLTAANATVTRGITHVESIKISIMLIKDPDGYTIELVQRDKAT